MAKQQTYPKEYSDSQTVRGPNVRASATTTQPATTRSKQTALVMTFGNDV